MRLSWLLPDLGLIVSLVTLFYCLFVFEGYRKLFRDSDTGWHIRTGESILAMESLPQTDPYSFSREGRRWFAWEWGADVLMGAAHRLWGLVGVALVYAVAIAGCTWLWFRLHWSAGGDFFLACAMASPMLSTVNLHWLARPHVFGWLFALAALLYAEAGPGSLVAVALFTAVWANLHASFFLAPLLALIYAVSYLIRPLLWNLDREREWSRAQWYALAAAAALAGSLVNPNGWRLHAHILHYLTNTELLARVGEYQSFNFHAEGSGQILLGIGLAGVGAVLALGQKRPAHLLLGGLLIAGALRSARGLPLVALLMLPLANGGIVRALWSAKGLNPKVRAGLDRFLAYSGRLRALDSGLGGLALAPVFVLLAFILLRSPAIAALTGFPPEEFPVAASAEVAKLPADARLLAPDKFGGYLIYRFRGGRKVYFDGRSAFYGAAFMKEYIRLVEVRPGWQEQVRAMGFTHALLPNNYSLVAALQSAGWRQLYRDGTATLLEAREF